jgi:hypothetical protein
MHRRYKSGSPENTLMGRRHPWLTLTMTTALAATMAATMGGAAAVAATVPNPAVSFEVESLDGTGNNVAHPTWGQVGHPYSRVTAARYGDGKGTQASGPNVRYISNRVFNDVNQNIFSEQATSQWGWTWGQFLDHTFGLAQGGTGTGDNIPFNASDPVERFTDTLGVIPFTRDAVAPGTGTSTANPRQQINTVNSYIDAWAVYGGTSQREEWMRDGPFDGNMANNAATLMLPGGYLPTRDARGDAGTAPAMAIDGRLIGHEGKADVAGDVRANENLGLTAVQTLFAREHNRIVSLLPNTLSAEDKFQIARRVVIAEQQYITYNEFLPAMGVALPAYTGYRSTVDPTLSNEFATVGYRAHSQIHGEFEVDADRARYTQAQLNAFTAMGIRVEDGDTPTELKLAIPLNVAFFNPSLLPQIGEGPMVEALSKESQYKNDALIDNQLRSTLFQIPKPGQTTCIEPVDPSCFTGVVDLGAIDIQRGRDHGMPTYNQLRQAYGLAPATSFHQVVGSSAASENFPRDPVLTPGNEINQLASLDFTALFDINGNPIPMDSPDAQNLAVNSKRRTPLAARLKVIYGSVNNLDAFVGMMSEPHLPGSDFGALQMAIWKKQFQALRDGDRFFYGNQGSVLGSIENQYGVDFHQTLAQVIAANTDIPASDLAANVFKAPVEGVTGVDVAATVSANGKTPDAPAARVPDQVPGRQEFAF